MKPQTRSKPLSPNDSAVLHAPWAIRREDLDLEIVQRTVDAIKRGETLPRTQSTPQRSREDSHT